MDGKTFMAAWRQVKAVQPEYAAAMRAADELGLKYFWSRFEDTKLVSSLYVKIPKGGHQHDCFAQWRISNHTYRCRKWRYRNRKRAPERPTIQVSGKPHRARVLWWRRAFILLMNRKANFFSRKFNKYWCQPLTERSGRAVYRYFQ